MGRLARGPLHLCHGLLGGGRWRAPSSFVTLELNSGLLIPGAWEVLDRPTGRPGDSLRTIAEADHGSAIVHG